MADWKSRATSVPAEEAAAPVEGGWKSRATAVEPEISQTESGLRGLAQGASMGFADEVSGGVEALWNKAKGDPGTFADLYKKYRDESRANFKSAEEANPNTYMAGQIGGAVGTALIPGMGGANIAKLAAQGAAQGLGSSEADLTEGDIAGAARDTAIGGATGAVAGAAGKALSKIPMGKILSKGADKLDEVAEATALNATGATGAQASKFAPGAGRELLDRGLVRAGDTADDIATRVAGARNAAHGQIDEALGALDAKGVRASADNVVADLEAKIAELSKDPSQAGTVRKLKGIVNDIIETGESNIPLSQSETTKRGFNKMAGNWMDPEVGQAGKQGYGAYMRETERAAEAADPALAKLFKEGKQTSGLLAPIEEASERAAMRANQAQPMNLSDLASIGVGSVGGIPGAVASYGAKKILAPRAASTLAVGADKLADVVRAAPARFGKYAKVLTDAVARGGNSLAATDFVLQQTNPEYRDQRKQIFEAPDDAQEE